MRTMNYKCPELIYQKFIALAKKKNISTGAYLRRLVLSELARSGALSVEELIENQMTETEYSNANGAKRGRPSKEDRAGRAFTDHRPKAKTLLG